MKGKEDERVVIGPRFGEDCAVIDIGTEYLVAKTDPISFATKDIGWYAVHVNANDVASMGAKPAWFQASILCPVETHKEGVEEVFRQIDATCKELNIAVTGGHTEITSSVRHMVVVGDMHGIVKKDMLVTSSGARPNHLIAMTKKAGIEGTSILIQERREILKNKLPTSLMDEALAIKTKLGISVVREALLAAKHNVTSMHDATEGGVSMALFEMAYSSSTMFEINLDKIPILSSTSAICNYFGINPLGLISSGTLLLTIEESNWKALSKAFQEAGILATPIGIVKKGSNVSAISKGKKVPFVYYEQDEITKVL